MGRAGGHSHDAQRIRSRKSAATDCRTTTPRAGRDTPVAVHATHTSTSAMCHTSPGSRVHTCTTTYAAHPLHAAASTPPLRTAMRVDPPVRARIEAHLSASSPTSRTAAESEHRPPLRTPLRPIFLRRCWPSEPCVPRSAPSPSYHTQLSSLVVLVACPSD